MLLNDSPPTRLARTRPTATWVRTAFLISLSAAALPALAASAPAQQLPPVVERALETMERSDQEGYAYKMVKAEPESTEVATFDPAKPAGQSWTLLQKDGKAPSAKEMESFRAEREKRDKKRAEAKKEQAKKSDKGGDHDLREMIEPGSLQLISENAERVSYRFKMRAEDEDAKAFAEAIRGTLVISKAAPHVESLDLASTGEIKPMTGVKISEFHLTLGFFPPDAYGQALPSMVHSVVKGRAMLVKKLDQDMKVSFSNYARRATSVTPAR